MEVHEKIKVMRLFRKINQRDMADKLGYSCIQSYQKLERGEIELTVSKLEEIAKVLEVTLQDLLGLNPSNVINIAGHSFQHINYGSQQITLLTESQCTQELDKARLIIEHQTKELATKDNEIEQLKLQLLQLQEINALLKKFQ